MNPALVCGLALLLSAPAEAQTPEPTPVAQTAPASPTASPTPLPSPTPAPTPDPCLPTLAVLADRPLRDGHFPRLVALGRPAAPLLAEALRYETDRDSILVLLTALSALGNHESASSMRRLLFSDDPELAAAATHAIARVAGRGAATVLERVMRENRSFAQTYAALEELATKGTISSFADVMAFADDPTHDPELVAMATRLLEQLDPSRARKRLQKRAAAARSARPTPAAVQR